MKFSIGDKIVLKQTDEEGVVVNYLDGDMFEVQVNGIRFPAHKDELDHPYLKWFTQKKQKQKENKTVMPEQLPVEKQKLRKPKLPKGVYISFFPEFKIEEMEDVVDYLKVYIVNELPKQINFQYDLNLAGESEFSLEGKLHDFGHVFVHSIPFEDMNDSPKVTWRIDDLEDPEMAPMEGVLKMKPQKVFQQVQQLLMNNEPSFSYLLFDDFKSLQEEFSFFPDTPPKKVRTIQEVKKTATKDLPKYEVDLHIEHIIDNYKGLSNAEIVMMQIAELNKYLRLAINNMQERLVVIHGVGKGKLRDEVHRILDETPEVGSFSNEWHGSYGFGATEVLFKY